MTKNRARATGRREGGTFAAFPHACLDHPKWAQLTPRAKACLIDLYAQFRGKNNGDLVMAWTVMRKRGWKSRSQLLKARNELEDAGWILLTRQGGRNRCSLYAVTFHPIDECKGKLELPATVTAPGDWKINSCSPPAGHPCTAEGSMAPKKGAALSQCDPPAVPVRPEIVIPVTRPQTPSTLVPRAMALKRSMSRTK